MLAGYVNMADIKLAPKPDEEAPFLSDEEVRQGIELLFFSYRDFTAEPDAILTRHDFGRAHHRVVHFVGRRPQMTVGELLGILRITKQSLNRVLGQLVRQGFVVQHRGPQDRRQRLLELTDKGHELERQLSAPQRARVAAAYRKAGAGAVDGFRKVLLNIIASPDDRRRFDRPRRR
jgi:DNA-binding MarR family transcriptional regulator